MRWHLSTYNPQQEANTPQGTRPNGMARTKGATSDKFWSEAVRLAVYREAKDDDGKKRKRLNLIADKLCKMAIEGDMAAIKEIGDRLDGKAPQGVDVTTGGDKLSVNVTIGGDDNG